MSPHFDLFREYASEPSIFWPRTHLRNARKIEKFLDEGRRERGESKREYVNNLVRLACLRARFGPKHVYLVNAGSSGSHWLEEMLGLLPGFHNGGEIYLPRKIKVKLKEMDAEHASMFLDALYFVHCGGIKSDMLSAVLSNSAHLAKHQELSQYSLNKTAVLLIRNPVDIAMSRTFRKDEYKNDVAPGATDIDYLERNCLYVERFYKNTNPRSFDLVVKYEALLENSKESLEKIASLLCMKVSEEEVDNAIKLTSKEEIKKSVESGSVVATNMYLGDKKDYRWARDYAAERLQDVMGAFGY